MDQIQDYLNVYQVVVQIVVHLQSTRNLVSFKQNIHVNGIMLSVLNLQSLPQILVIPLQINQEMYVLQSIIQFAYLMQLILNVKHYNQQHVIKFKLMYNANNLKIYHVFGMIVC
jgi:hypothetical protein